MPSQLDDGDISTLIEFSGNAVSYEEAAQLLRISSFSVETALNKLLDPGPGGLEAVLKQSNNVGWDGTAFAADRYGQHDGTGSIPSFNIEYAPGVDNYPHSGGPSGAPSRPPSRTSQRSGVSANASDAPRQSVENSQESGLISSSGQVFGPAKQEYYDNASWALVPATKSAEYIPDASIFYQSRDPEMPAFIKPTPNEDYLPALLTILHTIPQFRNALLAIEVAASQYWRGNDWWKGNATIPARIIDTTSGTEPASELDLIHETQRLMAFLEKTDRSYASLDSMFQLDAWKETRLSPDEDVDFNDDLLKFLLRWSWAYQKHVPQAKLNGVLRSTINIGGEHRESFVLDASIINQEELKDRNLYDTLDQMLFVSDSRNAHIVDISNVLILKLTASKEGTNLDCKIPAVFKADRYLNEHRGAVDDMFRERKQYEEQLTKIDVEVEKTKYHAPRRISYTQKMDILTMLKTSMRAFEPAFDPKTNTTTQDPSHASAFAQLEHLYQSIERKLSSLEEQKQKVREALSDVASRFREPVNNDGESTRDTPNRYYLRGVATSSLDYYIIGPEPKPDEPSTPQWWHVNYDWKKGDDATIKRERVTLNDVIDKASVGCSKALLVYANDASTGVERTPIAAALENFVKKDNFNFLQDFSRREAEWADQKQDDGSQVIGSWADEKSDGWNRISAEEFHNQGDSGVSSATLTPNTDIDDEGVGMEMQEVNGGISAWAGMSNASSDTVGADLMDISSDSQRQGTINVRDIEMTDAEASEGREEPKVEHIEVAEKKGG